MARELIASVTGAARADQLAATAPDLEMQAAFQLVAAVPAAAARVRTVFHRHGAGHAADGEVALVEQRIDGNVVVLDVALDVEIGPRRDGIDLHQAAVVALED